MDANSILTADVDMNFTLGYPAVHLPATHPSEVFSVVCAWLLLGAVRSFQ